MCLVSSSSKPRIAKKNIIVYKFVLLENNQYITPYLRDSLISDTTNQPKDVEKFGFRNYHIRGGYIHAFTSYEEAKHSLVWYGVHYSKTIIAGVIPRGTKYFVSKNRKQICAETINFLI